MDAKKGLLFTYDEDGEGQAYLSMHEICVDADMLERPKGVIVNRYPFCKIKDLDLSGDKDLVRFIKGYIEQHGSEPFIFHFGLRFLSRLKGIVSPKK